jgi:hypothetical protein
MLRLRYVGMGIFLSLIVIVGMATDPDAGWIQNLPFGSGLISHLMVLLLASSAAILLWMIRKVMFDYPEADHRSLLRVASRESTGAGLAIIGIAIHMLAFAVVIYAIIN